MNITLYPISIALIPRPTARCVLPTPGGPSRIKLYSCSTHNSSFDLLYCLLLNDCCSYRFNSSTVLSNGKDAQFKCLSIFFSSLLLCSYFIISKRKEAWVSSFFSACSNRVGRYSPASPKRS